MRRLVFSAEAGAYHAGVQHRGGHAGAFQAAGQLVGEHHAGQLRLAVSTLPGVVPLALQVVEVDAASGVGAGGDGDDPGGRARGEAVQQQAGQQERREVVEREGVLHAIGGDVPVSPEPADVVDQHVQPRVGVQYLSGQTAHPGLNRHVRGKGIHRRATRGGADARRGRLGAGRIPAGDADPGAQRGEPDGGGPAYAAGTSGDQNGLPGHERGVNHGSVLPRGRPKAVPGTVRGGTVLSSGLANFRVPCNHVTRWSRATCWHDA